jgi:hypothetical protein
VNTSKAPGWTHWPFRIVMSVAALLLFDQAVFAGQFLAGAFGALHTHRENATYAGITVLIAGISSVLLRWSGRGPWWPPLACLGLFGLIALQIILGFARALVVHIPLGVAIIMLTLSLTIWAWRYRPVARPAQEPQDVQDPYGAPADPHGTHDEVAR